MDTGKGKDMEAISIDAHGNNQEIVKDFLRALEIEGNWLGEEIAYSVPSLDEIE